MLLKVAPQETNLLFDLSQKSDPALIHAVFHLRDWLVSTYVVCERLSVMHELAGVVENLVQNSESNPLSEQTPLPTPPPPHENWNLGRSWHLKTFQFWLADNNPPSPKFKFNHFLALWVFSALAPYPPSPQKLKFSHFLTFWVFSVLAPYPPPQIEIKPFPHTLSIFSFGTLTPPPPKNWNLAISWHFEYFQFWHPTTPPNWNLGRSWHFQTLQFSVTEYPPPPDVISDTNGKLCVANYHMWRLYPARITTPFHCFASFVLQEMMVRRTKQYWIEFTTTTYLPDGLMTAYLTHCHRFKWEDCLKW